MADLRKSVKSTTRGRRREGRSMYIGVYSSELHIGGCWILHFQEDDFALIR